MTSPILSILGKLGSASQGYDQGAMSALQLQQARNNQAAQAGYIQALQYLANNASGGNPPPVPMAPGQPSVPSAPPVSTQSPSASPTASSGQSLVTPNLSQIAAALPQGVSGGGSGSDSPSLPPAVAANPLPSRNSRIPVTTSMPSASPPSMPSPVSQGAPSAAIPQPSNKSSYMDTVSKVVAAVNQAMPNADPAVKSIVAKELMQNVVTQQQQDEQRQSALQMREQQLSERERNDQTIAGIRQQLADVAAQRANTADTQGQEKIDIQKRNADLRQKALETKDQVTYTPDTIEKLARARVAGVPISQLVPGMGSNNPNRIAVENRATEINPNIDLADATIGYKTKTAEGTKIGSAAGAVDVSSRLLDETIPLARAAISQVDLSQFTDYNQLHNYALRHTSDSNITAADAALQGVASDYAQLLVRSGVSTDASRATADALANMKMGPEALEAFFGQVEKESDAARRATKKAKSDVSGGGSSATATSKSGWSFQPVNQ